MITIRRCSVMFFCLILLGFSGAFAENWKFVFPNFGQDDVTFSIRQGTFFVEETSRGPITLDVPNVGVPRVSTTLTLKNHSGNFNFSAPFFVQYFIDNKRQSDPKLERSPTLVTATLPARLL